jgi:hypothetical protein
MKKEAEHYEEQTKDNNGLRKQWMRDCRMDLLGGLPAIEGKIVLARCEARRSRAIAHKIVSLHLVGHHRWPVRPRRRELVGGEKRWQVTSSVCLRWISLSMV